MWRYTDPIPELKQRVAGEIARVVATGSLAYWAGILGTDRWRVAELRRGDLTRFSLETLIRFATRLRRVVELRFVDPARLGHRDGPAQ